MCKIVQTFCQCTHCTHEAEVPVPQVQWGVGLEGIWPSAPECGKETPPPPTAETVFWCVESAVVVCTKRVEAQHQSRVS